MFFLFVCCFLLFVGVSMATIIGKPPAVFGRPACPTCGTRMLLVRIFPDKPGHDQRTSNVRGVRMRLRKLFNP